MSTHPVSVDADTSNDDRVDVIYDLLDAIVVDPSLSRSDVDDTLSAIHERIGDSLARLRSTATT